MSINEHYKHNKNSNQINMIPFENEKINTKNSNSITSDKKQKLESMIFNNKESLKKSDELKIAVRYDMCLPTMIKQVLVVKKPSSSK